MRYWYYWLSKPSVTTLAARSDIVGLAWALGDSNDKVYEEAISALCDIGESAVPELTKILRSTREPWLRRKNAAVALGKMRCQVDVAPLLAALKDSDRNVQQGAVWAVGRLRITEAVCPLTDLLSEPQCSWYTKSLAVEALGNIGTPEAYSALLGFREHVNEELETLRSGGRSAELEILYEFVARRHIVFGGDPLNFNDMRDIMMSALLQFQEGVKQAINKAGK